MFYYSSPNIRNLLLYAILSATLSLTARAQEKVIYDSALAWKVTANNRVVYVVGERHNFFSIPDNISINHKLGIDIYNNSSTIYIEQKQAAFRGKNLPISKSVSHKLWHDIEQIVNKIISIPKSLSESEKINFATKILNEINESSPTSAYGNLIALSIIENNAKNRLKNRLKNINGLSYEIRKIDSESINKKIIPIENNNSASNAWFNYCSKNNETEILLDAALQNLKQSPPSVVATLENSQHTFLQATKKNINYHEKLINNNDQIEQIISKCIIISRNNDWIKKIHDDLKIQGQPIMIIAGIDHVIGNDGILTLLKNMGYADIVQIHELK